MSWVSVVGDRGGVAAPVFGRHARRRGSGVVVAAWWWGGGGCWFLESLELGVGVAIDVMNYAPLIAPGLAGPEYQSEEFQIMLRTTFKKAAVGGMVRTLWGREVPVDAPCDLDPTLRVEQALGWMDAAGYEVCVLACLKMWSYYYHHALIIDNPEEVVAAALRVAPDRFIGGAGYNPFRIDESIARLDVAVREWGFRYAYFHPVTFGVAPNDRRCYPLYAKCVELGIPVGMQVGHSAEVLPSDYGRPMLVDDVAIEFPGLKINLSHTGWPWTSEFCSVIWRHPNVYGDIAAYFPKSLPAELLEFMNGSRGRNKIMFGTNGFDFARYKQEFEDLPLSDKTKERVLHENAREFFGL
jgi:predicted TIM-barrel fold metal-dependent hydrolase